MVPGYVETPLPVFAADAARRQARSDSAVALVALPVFTTLPMDGWPPSGSRADSRTRTISVRTLAGALIALQPLRCCWRGPPLQLALVSASSLGYRCAEPADSFTNPFR